MAQKLIWSPSAASDLAEICAYIERDSPRYAAVVAQRVFDAIESLQLFPRSGRVVPEWDHPEYRETFVHSYRVIYRLTAQAFEIVAIIHASRDLSKAIGDRTP